MSHSRKFIVLVLLALILSVGVSPAAAAPASAPGNTQISGVGVFVSTDECPDLPSAWPPIKMAGDLVGCWYTDEYEVVVTTSSGIYQEVGTETFIGCLSDGTTCGTISTTYKLTARYAADGSEIWGHCEHPFASGTGDFAGITGRVTFQGQCPNRRILLRGALPTPLGDHQGR